MLRYEISVAGYLHANGADPNTLDAYGRTPAMKVVRVRYFANETTDELRASFETQVSLRRAALASLIGDSARVVSAVVRS